MNESERERTREMQRRLFFCIFTLLLYRTCLTGNKFSLKLNKRLGLKQMKSTIENFKWVPYPCPHSRHPPPSPSPSPRYHRMTPIIAIKNFIYIKTYLLLGKYILKIFWHNELYRYNIRLIKGKMMGCQFGLVCRVHIVLR